MANLITVDPPETGMFRIARQPADPFSFPEWERAGIDGTFGNRFDDPWLLLGLPLESRFRVIYCATQREAAFGETIARFRLSATTRAALALIDDDEPLDESLSGSVDPLFPEHGLLRYDWLHRRRIGHSILQPTARFVDLSHASTLAHLNEQLGPIAALQGVQDIDLSAMTSQARRLTQYAARYVHEQGFAGIRYSSRLGQNWECWALFEDRFAHSIGSPGFPHALVPDDPDLLRIAGMFGISIELLTGMTHFLRPW